jgi:plastocyanin
VRAGIGLGLLLVLAACGGATSPSGSVDCREPVNGVLTVTADDLVFDTACLALPAGEPVTIAFDNPDTQPHDIVIWTDSSTTTQLFAGEIIDPGESIEYHVPALDPGTFYFNCTVHPGMNGSVVVQ